MKLEHITSPNGDTIEITGTHGQTVSLNPPDAMMLLEWLNERRGELFRLTHGLNEEPQTFTQQTKPDEQTRFHASWIDDLEI